MAFLVSLSVIQFGGKFDSKSNVNNGPISMLDSVLQTKRKKKEADTKL